MAKNKTAKDYESIGHMIIDIVEGRNMHKLFWINFLRGIAYGLGIFLAGTIVIGFVIWLLSLFNHAPIIGPLVQNIIDNLNK